MVEFLHKHLNQNKFKIYQSHEILDWFKANRETKSSEDMLMIDLMKEAILKLPQNSS
jgi:hypothetical protein